MGVKFADEKLMEFNQIGQFKNKKYNNLIGLNEEMTPALATGTADGFVGSGLNFMYYVVPLKTLWDSGLRNGPMSLQKKTNEVIQAWKDICPGLMPAKSILKMTGIDFGPLRLPLENPTKDQEMKLGTALKHIGLNITDEYVIKDASNWGFDPIN